MTTDHKTSRANGSNRVTTRWPGARNSGPSWPSPAVTNGRIAVVAGAAVIDDTGSTIVAVATVEVGVGGNRSSGCGGGCSGRARDAHAACLGRRGNGSRKRRGSDKHQGNLFHW